MLTIEKYKKLVRKMPLKEIYAKIEVLLDPGESGFSRKIHLSGDDCIDLRILNTELQIRGVEFPVKPYRGQWFKK